MLFQDIKNFICLGWRLWSYFVLPVITTGLLLFAGVAVLKDRYETALWDAKATGRTEGRKEKEKDWVDYLKRVARSGGQTDPALARRILDEMGVKWRDRD